MFGIGLKELVVLGVYIYVVFKVLKKGEMTKKVIATAVALFFLTGTEGFSLLKSAASTLESDLKEAVDTIEGDIKGFQKASNINTGNVGKSPLDERGGGMMGPKTQAPGSQMPYDGSASRRGTKNTG